MPQQAMIYRVLIASPSDCAAERKIIPEILHIWNAAHSLWDAAILEPVLWETHAKPELGDRPQALINKQLVDHCDILIGAFWTRLGTSTGKAESGTAEEIEEFRKAGRRVLLYFSSAPVAPDSVDPEQYASLKAYKKKLEPEGLYFKYDSLEQLRTMLHAHVAGLMAELTGKQGPLAQNAPAQNTPKDDLAVLRQNFEAFLRHLKVSWESERDSHPMGIDDGKAILSDALSSVLEFRQQIVTGLKTACSAMEQCARNLRTMQRHQLFMDGGRSTRQFWENGDKILADLHTIPALLDPAADELDAGSSG